jgi:uncharacterized protein YfiM (DUF2279 family)
VLDPVLLRLAIAAAALLAEPATPAAAPAPAFRVPAAESWVGEDKVRHLGMSFAATTFGYAAARTAGVGDAALPAALAASGLAALGKELHDRRRGGFISAADLAWDALGLLAGYALLRNLQ